MSEDISDLIDNGPQQPVAAPQAATDVAQPPMAAASPQAPVAAPGSVAPDELRSHVIALLGAGASEESIRGYITAHGYTDPPDLHAAIIARAGGVRNFGVSIDNKMTTASAQSQQLPKTAEIADLIAAPAGSAAAPASDPALHTRLHDLAAGMTKPIDNLASLVAHGLPDDLAQGVRGWVAGHDADRAAAAHPNAVTAGGILTTLPMMAIPGVGEGAAGMALTGATSGALLSDANSGGQVVGDMVKGLVSSVAGGKAMQGIGGAIAPKLGQASAYLASKGVPLTLGQILGDSGGIAGRMAKSTEDKLAGTFPWLGDAIDAARERGLAAWNGSVGKGVVEPLRATDVAPQEFAALDAAAPGNDTFNATKAVLSKHYDDTLAQMQIGGSPKAISDLTSDLNNAVHGANNLGEGKEKQLYNVWDNIVRSHINPDTGIIDGEGFKAADSGLRAISAKFKTNPINADLADHVDQMRLALRNAATRSSSPELGQRLNDIDRSYANFRVFRDATQRAAGNEGVFTPSQLMTSVRAMDGSVGKGRVAAGSALLQQTAAQAQKVLPSRVGNSGTAARAMSLGTLPLMPLGMAASPLYSKTAQRAVQSIFTPGATRQTAGSYAARIPLGYIGTGLTVGGGSGAQ